MKRLSFLTLIITICYLQADAQSVGIGTNNPDASAILDVSGTNGGLLIPRLTAAQRDAITSPAKGLVVFNSTDNNFYCFDGAWKKLSSATEVWNLGGNSGTIAGSHFMGTNDAVPLSFGVNGFQRMKLNLDGRLELFSGNHGTVIGEGAGASITIGAYNTFIGEHAGAANQNAGYNVAIGPSAAYNNISGDYNVSIGVSAGWANQSGMENTIIGTLAGFLNSSGRSNVLIGYLAGYTTQGSNSVLIGNFAGVNTQVGNLHFVGYEAGRMNNTGIENHFTGHRAGRNNTSGSQNHFSGFNAGYSNTTGISNVYLGHSAGYNSNGSYNVYVGSATGYSATTGSYNTMIGDHSGVSITEGIHNYFSGYNAGFGNTSGSFNAFSGSFAGGNNTTGNFNIIYGHSSGQANVTGSNNILIGPYADVTVDGLINAGAIGYNAKVSQSNSFVIGGTGAEAVRVGIGVTSPAYTLHVNGSVAGVGAYNNISDSRLKTNISSIDNALAGILQLHPVSFDWKKETYPQFHFDDKRQIGFLAQELEKIFPEAVTIGADGFYTIAYSQLVPVVVQGIKEQQQQIENLRSENTQLKNLLELLSKEMEAIKKQMSSLQK
jgi:hypothetical protein